MVLITILTLALALLPVTERANAFVLTVAETLYIAGTILYSFGITYATDEDFRQGAKDFFYSCTDTVKKYIENIAIGAMAVPTFSYKIGAEMYKAISGDVVKYYKTYYDQSGVKVTAGKNGHVGFTADSQFILNLTNDSDDLCYIQHAFLNGMTITLYDKVAEGQDIFSHWAMQPAEADENANQQVRDYFKTYSSTVISVNKLSLTHYKFSALTRGTLTAGVATDTFPPPVLRSSTSLFYLFGVGVDGNNFYWKYNNQYAINGVVCYLMQCSDNKWRFVTYGSAFGSKSDYDYVTVTNSETNKTYDSFDTLEQFYSVVCDASGLDYPATKNTDEVSGDVYSPGAVPLTQNGVVPDVYNGTSDKTLTVPKSKAGTDVDVNDYGQIRTANPADVISDTTTIDYPDGVPNVDSSGISSKFPFCIPFDIYNLFVGLTAEEAPPKFVIPFKYASFDEVNITIDFSNDNLLIFAKVTRWFVGACFVFGLIMITRKVIGSN